MPRLFSSLVPPAAVLDHLSEWLAEHTAECDAALRWTPADNWHITLGFFGDDDDPVRRTKWLHRRATGRPAPRLRLAGAGTFPGVLWAGLHTDTDADVTLLARLAQAAGAGRRGYRPHLTLARWRSGDVDQAALIRLFDAYTGPWFTPDELLLMRSDFTGAGNGGALERRGPTYTTVDRLLLARV
jgi:2'-5' RNA ligase